MVVAPRFVEPRRAFTAEDLGRALNGQRKGREWRCRCPLHDNTTLCVRDGRKTVVVHCWWPGCDRNALFEALAARGFDLRRQAPARGGLRPASPAERARIEGARRKAEEEAARDDAGKIAWARTLGAGRLPLAGTVAERYLTEHRAIPRATLQRAALHFHPGHRATPGSPGHPALTVALHDENGDVIAVHAVRLDRRTARKVPGNFAKITNGKLFDRVLWLTDGPGDVLIAEGIEDALSALAAAPDAAAGIALGGVKRIIPDILRRYPTRRIVLVGQNLKRDPSTFDPAWIEAAESLAEGGADVWLAKPPPGLKDANDVLRDKGVEAVKAMLDAAGKVRDGSPHYDIHPLDVALAELRLDAAIQGLLDRAEVWLRGETPPQVGIKGAAGLGKTRKAVRALASRQALRDTHLEIYVPDHRLAKEWADDLRKADPTLRVIIIAGREHDDGDGPLCERADVAGVLGKAGLPVAEHLCHCRRDDGSVEECPHHGGCRYLGQFDDTRPAVRVYVHECLHLPRQPGLPEPHLAIIDERFWTVAVHQRSFGLDRLAVVPRLRQFGRDATAEVADLLAFRRVVREALEQDLPLLAGLRKAGIGPDQLRAAARTEFGGFDAPPLSPAMSDGELRRRLAAYERVDALARYRMWKVLEAEMETGRDHAHGVELRRDVPVAGDRQDRVHLHWRKPLRVAHVPVLVLDADLDPAIARLFLPHLEAVHLPVERRAEVIQVADTPNSKRQLLHSPSSKKRQDDLRAIIRREAVGGKRVLVIGTKAVRLALTGEPAGQRLPVSCPLPGGGEIAHFGAIRGQDGWKDYDTVIIVGREQPPPLEVEGLARGLWFDRPEPLAFLEPDATGNRRLPLAERRYRMRSGSASAPVAVHPDPDVQRVLEQLREQESAQALDRLRLIHATAAKRVLILSNVPLDVTVDTLLSWAEVVPSRLEQAALRGPAVPLSATEMHRCFPDLWPTERAAEHGRARRLLGTSGAERTPSPLIYILLRAWGVFRGRWSPKVGDPAKNGPGTPVPHWVRYWRSGQRCPSPALVRPDAPDLRAALEQVVGPVAKIEVRHEEGRYVSVDEPTAASVADGTRPWWRDTLDAGDGVGVLDADRLVKSGRLPNREAARKATQRLVSLWGVSGVDPAGSGPGPHGLPTLVAYKLAGRPGRHPSHAIIDLARHPDPQVALEAAVGSLSFFEIVEPMPANTDGPASAHRRATVVRFTPTTIQVSGTVWSWVKGRSAA